MDINRYESELTNWAPHPTQGWVKVVHRDPTLWRNQVYEQVLSNDSEDMLLMAHRKLGDARRYWAIADMNPSIESPDDMTWGQNVRVPLRGN